MNRKKIIKWIYNLKRLPATKREFASKICISGAIILAIMVYSIVEAMGHHLEMRWLIGLAGVFQIIGAVVFFKWNKAASKKTIQIEDIISE